MSIYSQHRILIPFPQFTDIQSAQVADPLDKLCQDFNYYWILKDASCEITSLYNDLRVCGASTKSYFDIRTDMSRRMMGIGLAHKADELIVRRFHVKESHDNGYVMKEYTGIYPKSKSSKTFGRLTLSLCPIVDVPPLEKLVFADNELDPTRMDLYSWMFKDSFSAMNLFNLPPTYIPLLTALSYLIHESIFHN